MPRPPRRVTLVAALLAGALAAAGCVNPFTPSRPQQPSEGQSVRTDYSRPDSTLATIARAFSARGTDGQQAYYDALADSADENTLAFYAFAAPGVADAWRADNPGVEPPAAWTRALEQRFFGYMSSYDTRDYVFTWGEDRLSSSDPPEDSPVAGQALKHRHYALAARSSSNPPDTLAVGYADLYFQKVNGNWRLFRWEDRIDPSYGLHPAKPNCITIGRRRLDSQSSQ